MKPTENATTISYPSLKSHFESYSWGVPKATQVLDTLRYDEVPEVLAQRRADGSAFLEKTEVTRLVDWKLKHGTYRPNLAKLVASNGSEDVKQTTKSAFETYDSNHDDYSKALSTLAKLKGIGPATASLLLACYDPVNVPFFSDELYRYLHHEEAKSKGWDRKIGYTMKEYKSLFERCKELLERVAEGKGGGKVKAVEIEKAAYDICHEAEKHVPQDEKERENDDVLAPPSPKRRKTSKKKEEDPPKSPDPVSKVFEKGPNGSPTFDELGYELDKDFILQKVGGRPRPLGKKALERLHKRAKDQERKVQIMGVPKECNTFGACDDRVAKDLGIAFHEVGVEEFEQWKEKGFTVKKEDFENPSEEENKRLMRLSTGCALRLGSKHR